MWLSVMKGIQFVISTLPQLVPRAKSPRPTLAFAGNMSFRLPPNLHSSPQTNFYTRYCRATGLRDLSSIDLELPGGPCGHHVTLNEKQQQRKVILKTEFIKCL